ncbi:glycosyltransferase [Paenibacillus sp. P46E]|uniref:glycosyltransferase n=1 Tax=Paenibacillus sp. P46E TaxID=1349436 RepID=UPI00093C7D02|nr:glycosyltransferase [Paenibacillus sp. P46E]OKP98167.1 hypothetical protein A3849_11280 [Paenibacillus sp. P46E]
MKNIVFVNNPAATSGGALTILKQFIQQVAQKNKNISFYIFCSSDDLIVYERENIKIIVLSSTKNWMYRMYWDYIGLKRWSINNKIFPSMIISLQNTGVYNFKRVPQVIYLHQSFPYYREYTWSLFKSEERAYWFYRNVYKHLIHLSLTKQTKIIVQSNWLKKRVSNIHNLNVNDIFVIKPHIEAFDKQTQDDSYESFMFFPASGQLYKNHEILIRALSIIKQKYQMEVPIVFTLSRKSQYSIHLSALASQLGVDNLIDFVGDLSYEEVLEYFRKSRLVVFPSYIETFGLPLVEAASFKKPIIASDLEYAREALEGYTGVEFVRYNNSNEWAEAISNNLLALNHPSYSYEGEFDTDDKWKAIFRDILD